MSLLDDGEQAHTEQTLSVLPTAHVYTLPPRPSAGGWKCQDWPKTNLIFTGRVVIVALGELCTIKLMDTEKNTLFAQCPLDNDNPQLSVEPVSDSSRYFVLRVSDGSGRHAYLGMGFLERPDAFEFNVTLQDHVKRLRNEKEAAKIASAPAPPPTDFTLKGSVNISLPGGAKSAAKPKPAAAGGLSALLPPPPSGQPSSRGRPRAAAPSNTGPASATPAAAAPAAAPGPAAAAPAANPFGTDPFGGDPFGATFGSDPFAAMPAAPVAPAVSAAPAALAVQFGSDPFGSDPFGAPSNGNSATVRTHGSHKEH